MFEIGQQVVCVDADGAFDSAGDGRIHIAEGAVYIVRWVGMYAHDRKGIYCGVRLSGIIRPGSKDTPYRATRFRPLRKTDISIFTAMLEPKPAKEREVA